MKTANVGKRRILSVVASLLLIALTLSAFIGCRNKTGDVDEFGSVTVVVAVGEDVRAYEVSLEGLDGAKGAIVLLDHLKAEGKLDYTAEDSGYGPYLTRVGHLEQNAGEGIYVGIWTNVESDIDRESIYATTVEYNGAVLYSANVGMGELNVPDGAVIYFGELRY